MPRVRETPAHTSVPLPSLPRSLHSGHCALHQMSICTSLSAVPASLQPAAFLRGQGRGSGGGHTPTLQHSSETHSLLSPDSISCKLTAHLPPPHPGCSLAAHFPLKEPPQSRAWASNGPPGFVPLAGGAPESSQGAGHSSHGRGPRPHKHRGL